MINWYGDYGVIIWMINDFVRNQFYDDIFRNTVKDKNCLEIGFGTGILSILALQHGAKHIVAYEQNENNYNLGLEIIEKLNLKDKIELHHKKYTNDDLKNHKEIEVVFHEVFSYCLWGETDLIRCIPRDKNILSLPGSYTMELYATPIPKNFAKAFFNILDSEDIKFVPGIDIDQNYIEEINQRINNKFISYPELKIEKNLNQLELQQIIPSHNIYKFTQEDCKPESVVSPALKLIKSRGKLLGSYTIDTNNHNIIKSDSSGINTYEMNFSESQIELNFDFTKNNEEFVLLVPRYCISYNDVKMYLDDCYSWHMYSFPTILYNFKNNLIFNQNLITSHVNIRSN